MKKRFKNWLLLGIETQLFLLLCSLPLLLAWGMPISLASVVGNFLFAPFLMTFLFCSSALFFAQLLHIPCDLLAHILELVTNAWIWLVQQGSPTWMHELYCPNHITLIMLLALTVAILIAPMKQYSRILAFACLFALTCGICHFWQRPTDQFLVPTNQWHTITIMHTPTHTALIDHGGLCYARPSWARFTLKPLLVKKLGRSKIDYCILMRPRIKNIQNAATLCSTVTVKEIYLPAWQGNPSVAYWHALSKLTYTCKKRNTHLKPIAIKPIELAWDTRKLMLTPQESFIDIDQIKIPTITLTVDPQSPAHT